MSLPSQEPVADVKNSIQVYAVDSRVQVVGGNQVGELGKITTCSHLVTVVLDNGVHVTGPFTLFKLIK